MKSPNTKRKMTCFWCGRRYIDLIKHTDKQHEGLIPRSYDIHKPCKKIESSKLSYSTSYLGEKLTLKEKETADMLIEYVVEMDKKLKEALIKELRKKNPITHGYRNIPWDECCDELEKMLKE